MFFCYVYLPVHAPLCLQASQFSPFPTPLYRIKSYYFCSSWGSRRYALKTYSGKIPVGHADTDFFCQGRLESIRSLQCAPADGQAPVPWLQGIPSSIYLLSMLTLSPQLNSLTPLPICHSTILQLQICPSISQRQYWRDGCCQGHASEGRATCTFWPYSSDAGPRHISYLSSRWIPTSFPWRDYILDDWDMCQVLI